MQHIHRKNTLKRLLKKSTKHVDKSPCFQIVLFYILIQTTIPYIKNNSIESLIAQWIDIKFWPGFVLSFANSHCSKKLLKKSWKQESPMCRELYLMEHADTKSLINVPFGKWWNTNVSNMLRSVGTEKYEFQFKLWAILIQKNKRRNENLRKELVLRCAQEIHNRSAS